MVVKDLSLPLSGIFFLLCGIWWSVQIAKKYYYDKQQRIAFKSSTTYACCFSCRRFPVESVVKFLYSTGYIIYEIILATDGGKAKSLNYVNLLHMTVFAFFAFCFIIEIIQHFKVKFVVFNLEYVTLIFAFGAQALLYGCNFSTNYTVKCIVHKLIQITALMCCAITALELKFRDNIIFPLCRGMLVMVLGTWMLHSSVILLDNQTDNPDHMWMITLYFTWHCGIGGVVMLCILSITSKLFKHNKCCCLPVDYGSDSEAVCLHNRVRFDYPLLDRFESDVD